MNQIIWAAIHISVKNYICFYSSKEILGETSEMKLLLN